MIAHFDNDDFQFGLEIALGCTYRQASDIGEVLATAERIKDGDDTAWVREWTATAGTCWASAQAAEAAHHRVSATSFYRRAATYYATALYRIAGTADGNGNGNGSVEVPRQLDLWRRQRACWEKVVDLQPVPGERLTIRYEDTTLPAFLFRAPDAEPGEPRPLVIINNGSDGATSQTLVDGGAGAAERGYHWMTFDGPGQQAALYEQGIPFRPDWEAVLTPVLDAMLARPDVDQDRVAVVGVSQAGYWVPRALAFEHRFVAAVADPGVVDVSSSWTDPLPQVMRNQLSEGKQSVFDREMHLAELFHHDTKTTLAFRGHPYGVQDDSRFALYQTVAQYRLGDEIEQITTPLLITNPEGEQFWPGQAQQLYDRLPGVKQLVTFTAAEGANRHCEPMARSLRDARIYDWLEKYLR
jgi:S-formylglutathione hydrolase FrmB